MSEKKVTQEAAENLEEKAADETAIQPASGCGAVAVLIIILLIVLFMVSGGPFILGWFLLSITGDLDRMSQNIHEYFQKPSTYISIILIIFVTVLHKLLAKAFGNTVVDPYGYRAGIQTFLKGCIIAGLIYLLLSFFEAIGREPQASIRLQQLFT